MRRTAYSEYRSGVSSRRLLSCLVLLCLAGGGASAPVQHIYVLHTNDIQGALVPSQAWWMSRDFPPPLGNGPSALTVIGELRSQAAERGYGFVLLDAGDAFKGSPVGDFTRGQAVVDYFNRAGYDAIGVGSDDFAYGRSALESLVGASGIPWVCANIRVPGSDTAPAFLRPRIMLETGGVKVGVVGLITSYNNQLIPDSLAGDLEVGNETEIAREQVAALRAEGADIVVGLTHVGHRYEQRLAEDVPGFDVIVGGRSHTIVDPPVETPRNHTIVCQAGSRLTAVGFLDLTLDRASGRLIDYEGRIINLFAEEIPVDPGYLAELESLRAVAEEGFDEVLGHAARTLTRSDLLESPLGDLVTDAMREHSGADIALVNSSGIRADMAEGEVTYRDIYGIDEFGNSLVSGTYTGRQVREMLEIGMNEPYSIFQVSGVRFTCQPGSPFGSRIRTVTVGAAPLDPSATYRVVTSSYLGGPTGRYRVFQEGEDVSDTGFLLRDAIAAYVRRHSPVDAAVEGRITESAD